jgi:tripartite-type tricarboxylate transporter receptor subunit TctC
MDIWIGVFAPAGTPAPIVERLNREINAIAASPELAVLLGPDGTLPTAMSPAAFAARVKDELAKWKQLAAAHKIVASSVRSAPAAGVALRRRLAACHAAAIAA